MNGGKTSDVSRVCSCSGITWSNKADEIPKIAKITKIFIAVKRFISRPNKYINVFLYKFLSFL